MVKTMKTRERRMPHAHLQELAGQPYDPVRLEREYGPDLVGYVQLRDVDRSVAHRVEEGGDGAVRAKCR